MKKSVETLAKLIEQIETKLSHQRAIRSASRNLHHVLWERAIRSSADFVEQYLSSCLIFRSKEEMWDYVCKELMSNYKEGLVLEFGVAGGKSINYLARKLPAFNFIGFDSFEGLKEDWMGHNAIKGSYSQAGQMPKVPANVELVKGWFDQTIPVRLEKVDPLKKIHLYHIDGDTYEAACTVLNNISQKLTIGDLVLFDELIGYPGWVNGEFRALKEAQKKFNFDYIFRAFSSEQALIEITLV